MRILFGGALAVALVFAAPIASMADEPVTLTLFSARKAHLIEPVLELYTQQTGVQFKLHTNKAGPLLERLSAAEGRSGADILLTVDAGNLWQAAERGLFEPVDSPLLEQAIPEALRDPQNRWFGFSKRARTLIYNPNRVRVEELSTYEDLAMPKWQGRLCLRTSKKVYNQSLTAALIAQHGEAGAQEIVAGWVNNLSVEPFSNDTKAILAVDQGLCDVTIVNSYYYGRQLRMEREYNLDLFWPNQDAQGVHINVSGAGLLKQAPNPREARAFLEWLAQPQAQELFAQLNYEYPVLENVPVASSVRDWGEFRGDDLNLSEVGRLQAAAVRLMDRAGWR